MVAVPPRRPNTPSRRAVLLGGGATLLVGSSLLVACGGDDSGGSDGSTTPTGDDTTVSTGAASPVALAQFFSPTAIRAGIEQRMPFGLGDADGVIAEVDAAPPTIDVEIFRDNRTSGDDPVTGDPIISLPGLVRRADGIPRPYYSVVWTPPEPGFYVARATVEGATLDAAVQALEPDFVKLVQAGDPMIPVETPTVDDARGVTPICTRDPRCPLHDRTLTQALDEGKPVAFLISTPAFCSTAICGPVLDVLLGMRADYAGVTMLHAEVYTDPAEETGINGRAEATVAYNLEFEPSLYLARADGTLFRRLDFIWDESELRESLDALTAP